MYQEETPKRFLEKVQHTNMYNHFNQQTFILNSLVYDGYCGFYNGKMHFNM